MKQVYSYLRFSAAKQADGNSADRQQQYAEEWAAKHGLVLDSALSMRDEGLSAYHQRHVKSGALGAFLKAVTAGRIPEGSILIVEGLDRLSRADPIDAQAQLTQIINAGITVVTASDGKEYSREKLRENPMDLILSLLVMMRANNESVVKSDRVSKAFLNAARNWQAGKRVPVPGGRVPAWITRGANGAYILNSEPAEAMREAIRLYLAGYGAVKILDEIKRQGFKPILKDTPNNLDSLLRNKAYLFLGNREMKISGEDFTLEGYYPPLIDVDTYNRLRIETAKRKQRPHTGAAKSAEPNLFSGLGLCRCGACGTKILSNNRKLKAPRGEYWYRRLRCPTCQREDPQAAREPWADRYGKGGGSCNPEPLEQAVFGYCADQFNLESLFAGDDNGGELRKEQRAVISEIERDEKQLAKIVKLSLEGDADIPAVLVRQMQEIETRIAANKNRENHIAIELKVRATKKPVDAEAWQSLRAAFFSDDDTVRTPARIAARKLFEDTFSAVRVFFQAASTATGAPALGLELTSKTGEVRLLTVDRKTGELQAIERNSMLAERVTDTSTVQVAKARTLKKETA